MPAQANHQLAIEADAAAVAKKFTVIDKMADAMREIDAARGCCTIDDLKLRGFSATQIELYADDARAIALTRSHRRTSRVALSYEASGIGQPVHPRGAMVRDT
ncbi:MULTISPECIES: hypothetical protein [unclassified Chelatococcus]|uniref:hypothetical protein n=1 Tax=unclassified Chelatococcus TaxID=2638111 RepID=UPI001BD13F12|nr:MULTISPECIES: hypothetical protein [unclassified Chelatococcus]CAH1670563.1 hypothetical protein CHELA41_23410 [Hyphomicrobiales bacterium]MBS7738353.1 hypothetical protein [Chelatococcus sp. HY11]MBX3545881.1 hypothetical protein [Chelatococcus sp.]MCO5077301.1 hypothetical protein [Chelatococcus sp.]CAH1677203.1 hypothetical protein CHELA20_51602 [Hyphomicrobiales bacterium]